MLAGLQRQGVRAVRVEGVERHRPPVLPAGPARGGGVVKVIVVKIWERMNMLTDRTERRGGEPVPEVFSAPAAVRLPALPTLSSASLPLLDWTGLPPTTELLQSDIHLVNDELFEQYFSSQKLKGSE